MSSPSDPDAGGDPNGDGDDDVDADVDADSDDGDADGVGDCDRGEVECPPQEPAEGAPCNLPQERQCDYHPIPGCQHGWECSWDCSWHLGLVGPLEVCGGWPSCLNPDEGGCAENQSCTECPCTPKNRWVCLEPGDPCPECIH